MEVIAVDSATNTLRALFFRLAFGEAEGYVCIAHFDPVPVKKMFIETFFEWPRQQNELLEHVNKIHVGNNVYFCPQIFAVRKRTKECVKTAPTIWADLDGCPPEELLVPATLTIESSTDRYQALWVLEKAIDPLEAEDLSRRIAYKHADAGADKSGWDLTQLLRVPFTYNYKYDPPIVVKTIKSSTAKFRATDFEKYPQAAGFQFLDIPMPVALTEGASSILTRYRNKLGPQVGLLFSEVPTEDWSGRMWKLLLSCMEAGMLREEAWKVGEEAACNKYERDNRPMYYLWKEVCRAWNTLEIRNKAVIPRSDTQRALLSDAEREHIAANPGFIERYIEWAKSLGDAAWQYHQAGAFITLSSLLAGTVRLPTSFGTIIPNLWFMILADTTLTRKSTAMDIAMDLVMDTDSEAVLATDGSIEGLLTSLSTRPGRPSVFLRDEFSGLLEAMTKKDYMAGMAESLTKLYDGKFQKRILRKEVIEVRDPVLILFAGGIRTRICSLLNYEHITSGFMPRFIFITAESDVTRLKPLGRPTQQNLGNRQEILTELKEMMGHYHISSEMTISATQQVTYTPPKFWKCDLTDAAWSRYNSLEARLMQDALDSRSPELLMPTYDRLAKSGLKAAILLSAARQRPTDEVIITEEDIVRAFYYVEGWREYATGVINNVGKTGNERQMDLIVKAIRKRPGISRSVLMQNYHLDARMATQLFETLEQRGLISRQKAGRGEVFYPVEVGY